MIIDSDFSTAYNRASGAFPADECATYALGYLSGRNGITFPAEMVEAFNYGQTVAYSRGERHGQTLKDCSEGIHADGDGTGRETATHDEFECIHCGALYWSASVDWETDRWPFVD